MFAQCWTFSHGHNNSTRSDCRLIPPDTGRSSKKQSSDMDLNVRRLAPLRAAFTALNCHKIRINAFLLNSLLNWFCPPCCERHVVARTRRTHHSHMHIHTHIHINSHAKVPHLRLGLGAFCMNGFYSSYFVLLRCAFWAPRNSSTALFLNLCLDFWLPTRYPRATTYDLEFELQFEFLDNCSARN